MAWLGEELHADRQAGGTGLVPRTINDLVEEQLFARRHDLFTELSVVFVDTTSLSFAGAGGETLGEPGYSNEHRRGAFLPARWQPSALSPLNLTAALDPCRSLRRCAPLPKSGHIHRESAAVGQCVAHPILPVNCEDHAT